jgi:ABC-type enterobactin transport system permease subunit
MDQRTLEERASASRATGGVVLGAGLFVLVLVLFVGSLAIGAVTLILAPVIAGLFGQGEAANIIVRGHPSAAALLALTIGATLGLSGAVLQGPAIRWPRCRCSGRRRRRPSRR